jgi:LacI family transcriptional regulator
MGKHPRMKHDRKPGNVTIVDVAREAGVSYSTVSRVVNNNQHVRSETRERVINAMMRLGYVVNQQARSLRGGRSQVIGLLVPTIGNSYIGEIIRGIDAELSANQYDLMLYTTHRRKTKESAYVATITRGMADGLLLLLPTNIEAYSTTLRQQQFPHVLIDHEGIDDNSVAIRSTNWQGAYDATCYLLNLGHRRIALITGIMELSCSVDRLAGYEAAYRDHGLEPDPALIYEGDFFRPNGYEGASYFLDLPEPPTAIFASNDISAFGVIEAIRNRGLQIPDDVSVIGFDNIPEASHVHPGLTTVRQPLEHMGRLAVKMLFKRLEDPDLAGERVELATELIVRETCAPPPNHRR